MWVRQLQNHYWVHFILAVYCWAWGMSLSMIYISSEISLEKTSSFFESSWQLEKTFRLGMWAHVHFPFSVLGLHLDKTVQALYMMPHSLWVHMCVNPDVLGRQFLWLLQYSYVLFCIPPEPWEEEINGNIPFRTECFKVSHSLPIVQLSVSVLVPIYFERKFLG